MGANLQKISRIIGMSAFIAFLAFNGFTTFSVHHLSNTVDEVIARIETSPAIEAPPVQSDQIAQAPQYGQAVRMNSTTVEDPTVENPVDSAFAAPLGATASRPSAIETARSAAAITIPDNVMTASIIAITVALSVFSLALVANLLISRRFHRKKY